MSGLSARTGSYGGDGDRSSACAARSSSSETISRLFSSHPLLVLLLRSKVFGGMIILRGGGVRLRPSSDDGGGESDERDELSAALMILCLYHRLLGWLFQVRDGNCRKIIYIGSERYGNLPPFAPNAIFSNQYTAESKVLVLNYSSYLHESKESTDSCHVAHEMLRFLL